MKNWIVSNNQISGWIDADNPGDFISSEEQIITGPDAPQDKVYYSSSTNEVLLRPEQPTPDHYWDTTTNTWALPPTEPVLGSSENWGQLESTLRGSSFFNKAWWAAGESTKCNRNLMQLQMALSGTRNFQDFRFAFNVMRVDITALTIAATVPGFTDFTQSELDELSTILAGAGFDVSEFNLLAD